MAQYAAEAVSRALLEGAPDGIVVTDASGVIAIVNSEAERLFGYPREELIGQSIEILVPQRFRKRHVDDRREYHADPKLRPMGAGRALTGLTKDGNEIPVEISLSPLVTDRGQLVMSVIRDVTESRHAERIIQASLREKEALLREIHHRVKNNLQVTSSLLRLQAASVADERVRRLFEDTESRIRSMALVHEKLYQSANVSHVELAEYIRSLGDLLFQSSVIDPARVTLDVSGPAIFLSIETAVPVGLIVNELLSNALEHAFRDGRRGTIDVALHEGGGAIRVRIRDDGIGLPPAFAFDRTETLGLRLVAGLAEQIEGTIAVEERGGGAAFSLVFPRERAR